MVFRLHGLIAPRKELEVLFVASAIPLCMARTRAGQRSSAAAFKETKVVVEFDVRRCVRKIAKSKADIIGNKCPRECPSSRTRPVLVSQLSDTGIPIKLQANHELDCSI